MVLSSFQRQSLSQEHVPFSLSLILKHVLNPMGCCFSGWGKEMGTSEAHLYITYDLIKSLHYVYVSTGV